MDLPPRTEDGDLVQRHASYFHDKHSLLTVRGERGLDSRVVRGHSLPTRYDSSLSLDVIISRRGGSQTATRPVLSMSAEAR